MSETTPRDKSALMIMLELGIGAIATVSTTASVATWQQIQNSDRAIVRLETQFTSVEKAIDNYQSAIEEIKVLNAQLKDFDRRLSTIENR